VVELRPFLRRLEAMVVKEFIELKRDRATLGMIVFLPIMQLILFGYAINMNPRHLPTAVLSQDTSRFARSLVATLKATSYFDIVREAASEEELDYLIKSGEVMFAVQIPPDFGRKLRRGERPAILIVADATDPSATGNAVAALNGMADLAFSRDLIGPSSRLRGTPEPYEIRVHKRYNPAGETRINIVPGLLGVILTMTMLIFTALAVTRETERGTIESLLAMPLRPTEIMLGKILPYVLVGFVQMSIILLAARFIFAVPIEGSLMLLLGLTMLFISANLAMGYTFSTISRTQLQAVQMSFMFFLPNILLSGFMFPFDGMPHWAQVIGEALPLTHYNRIVRGIMLKDAGIAELGQEALMMLVFMLAAMALAVLRFRRTLD
jgi:ABC-2 type transport system permease protein